MKFTSFSRILHRKLDQMPAVFKSAETTSFIKSFPLAAELPEGTVLRTMGWVSAGLGAVALGLVVGRELRQRYKFNRRTPYDFYAHSGDEIRDMEFGVGI